MLIASLFTTAEAQKQPKRPSADNAIPSGVRRDSKGEVGKSKQRAALNDACRVVMMRRYLHLNFRISGASVYDSAAVLDCESVFIKEFLPRL